MISTGCDLWPARRHVAVRSDPETAVRKSALPAKTPRPHTFDFATSTEEAHVRPLVSSVSDRKLLTSEPGSEALTDGEKSALNAAARNDTRVASALGPRAAFIDAELVPADAKADFGCCKAATAGRHVVLTYYNYANDVAVQVTMKNNLVAKIDRREEFVPSEGEEEIHAAVDLARQDVRLAGRVQGLVGHALLMEPERGVIWNDAGYGHRVLWVTFEQGTSGDPLFWAVVDLSVQRVFEAGEEPRR